MVDTDLYWIVLCSALVFGAISGGVAGSRGLKSAAYFFGGFFLGPIGVLIAALARNPTQENEQKMNSDDFRKCPACAEAIRSEAVKCRYCGEQVSRVREYGPHFSSPFGAKQHLEGKGYKIKGHTLNPTFDVNDPSGKKFVLKSPEALIDFANKVYAEKSE